MVRTKKGITTDIKDSQNQLASHGDITLHPNPTNENITIQLKNSEIINIQMFNSLGIKCFEDKNGNAMEYNLKINETQGLYYVKVTTKQFEKV